MGHHEMFPWIWRIAFFVFVWQKHDSSFHFILNLKNFRDANFSISIDTHHTKQLDINDRQYANYLVPCGVTKGSF